jgi:hypothetical protein
MSQTHHSALLLSTASALGAQPANEAAIRCHARPVAQCPARCGDQLIRNFTAESLPASSSPPRRRTPERRPTMNSNRRTTPRLAARPIETLPPMGSGHSFWCWSRLATTNEGTLSFEMPRGRVNLPVPYAVQDRQIIIALASINTTGWQAAGGAAALVVTGTDHQDLRWSVRASGQASRTHADEHDASLLASREDRPRLPSDAPPQQLVLTSVDVSGRYETARSSLPGHDEQP